jgi:hypothetical protein
VLADRASTEASFTAPVAWVNSDGSSHPAVSGARAAATAPGVAKRSAGSLAIIRSTIAINCEGRSGRN